MKNIIITAIIALALVACKFESKKVKIGFLFGDFNAPRWEKEANFFKEHITELGGEVFIANADGNSEKQRKQAEEFIEKGVDVIVITIVNSNSAAAIVGMAHDKGVKVIAYDGLITNTELDYLAAFDLEKVGEEQAKYLVNKKRNGNYVLLHGDKTHAAAKEVNKGAMKIIKPYIESGEINIIYEDWIENWSVENAEYSLEKVLEIADNKIDAIIAASDGIAEGAHNILKKRNLKTKILISGQDGELSACNRIMQGKQTMTVYKSSKKIAYAAARLAYDVASGRKVNGLIDKFNGRVNVKSLIIEPTTVDASNIETIIVVEGAYSMSNILAYNTAKQYYQN